MQNNNNLDLDIENNEPQEIKTENPKQLREVYRETKESLEKTQVENQGLKKQNEQSQQQVQILQEELKRQKEKIENLNLEEINKFMEISKKQQKEKEFFDNTQKLTNQMKEIGVKVTDEVIKEMLENNPALINNSDMLFKEFIDKGHFKKALELKNNSNSDVAPIRSGAQKDTQKPAEVNVDFDSISKAILEERKISQKQHEKMSKYFKK